MDEPKNPALFMLDLAKRIYGEENVNEDSFLETAFHLEDCTDPDCQKCRFTSVP